MIGSATEEAYELTPGNAGDVGGVPKNFLYIITNMGYELKIIPHMYRPGQNVVCPYGK